MAEEREIIPIGKAQNLIGKVFGKWTVLNRAPNTPNRRGANWWCQCSCSNQTIKSVRGDQLTRGISTSCGCYAIEVKVQTGKKLAEKYNPINGRKNKIDLTGQKFGKLTVLEDTGKRVKLGNGTGVVWKCICECGNFCEVTSGHLQSKHTTSCGCRKISIGEEEIFNLLTNNNIEFQFQYRNKKCQFSTGGYAIFDFFVNNEYYIEYDGEQHFSCDKHGWNNIETFEKTKIRDKEKNNWCIKNNIPLIRIPYTQKHKIKIEDLILSSSSFLVTKGENNNAADQQ